MLTNPQVFWIYKVEKLLKYLEGVNYECLRKISTENVDAQHDLQTVERKMKKSMENCSLIIQYQGPSFVDINGIKQQG